MDWVFNPSQSLTPSSCFLKKHLNCNLIHNVALVSSVQQSDLVLYIRMYISRSTYSLPLWLVVHAGMCLLSAVQLFVTLWTVACQTLLSVGFFQARIPEWVAISSSRRSSWSGIEPALPAMPGRVFITESPPGDNGWSQKTEYQFPVYTVWPCCLSILYIIVCFC